MADTRKITIEILDGNASGDSQKNKSKEKTRIDNQRELNKFINRTIYPLKDDDGISIGKTVILNQAYQQAKQMLNQTIDLSLNRYYTLTEDYLGQTNYQNIRNIYGKVTGLAASIGGGAIIGGPIGAAIGAVSWGVNQYIQNKANLSGYYQDLNAANFNTDFNRTRAGLVNEGRGTDN